MTSPPLPLRLVRTDSTNPDFVALVRQLDADLAIRDGEDHAFFAQYNKIALINHVIVAWRGEQAVSCGAIKEYEPGTMEVKRMFTLPETRGQGVATQILGGLEAWARELGYAKCILETGIRQPEALALYHKNGYQLIPNYGQYATVESSRCFEKML
ncbi:MAG: GNAT family N-acetyltransferase [Bacteroidia bacterium]|nr:GNAT family N-acetyltransferase [Bacteroidia bacterium]